MRISRPCYDKMHRCPGWAGGGFLAAKVERCAGGRVGGDDYSSGRFWRWRFNRCSDCPVLVLPYVVRWLDPRWLSYAVGGWRRNRRYR